MATILRPPDTPYIKYWRDYDDGTGELTINGSKFADGRAHWLEYTTDEKIELLSEALAL